MYLLGISLIKKLDPSNAPSSYESVIQSMVINTNDMDIRFDDIKGHSKTKDIIKSVVIKPLENNVHTCRLLQPPNGIIFHGYPGTGKTMMAKAVAKATDSTFINFEWNKIEQKLYGESTKIIDALFTFANKHTPVIVFIDEIDGFFSERSPLDQSHVNSVKTFMLSKMDGVLSRPSNFIFIGATNNLHTVDKAIRRRMRTHISFNLPDSFDRINLFKEFLEEHADESLDYESISAKTEGMSGSDIFELCKHAAHSAYDSHMSIDFKICEQHIISSLDLIS